jgi:2-keto-3-deoxygluconate permease
MKIKARVEQVPGGMMMVPLICDAMITTLAPHMGSFTNALFSGALPILAVFYVCIGATISIRSLPVIVRRGGAPMAAKIALGIVAGTIFGHHLGTQPVASGWYAGLSMLAIVAAINDTNGGLTWP